MKVRIWNVPIRLLSIVSEILTRVPANAISSVDLASRRPCSAAARATSAATTRAPPGALHLLAA